MREGPGSVNLGAILAATAAMVPGVVIAAAPTPAREPDPNPRRRKAPARVTELGGWRTVSPTSHGDEREIARRLRQAARNAERQRERYLEIFSPEQMPPECVGLSRRGGLVFL